MPNGEVINYLKKVVTKKVLHFFWIYPVKKEKVFLLNELSHTYGDSIKYIHRYLKSNGDNKYQFIISIKKGYEAPDDVMVVRPGSFDYFKEILSSGIIITNAGGISYLPKRKEQKIINTWHGGGPYKKTSTDVYNNYWYRKEVKMNCDNTDYILSSCRKKQTPWALKRSDVFRPDCQGMIFSLKSIRRLFGKYGIPIPSRMAKNSFYMRRLLGQAVISLQAR